MQWTRCEYYKKSKRKKNYGIWQFYFQELLVIQVIQEKFPFSRVLMHPFQQLFVFETHSNQILDSYVRLRIVSLLIIH